MRLGDLDALPLSWRLGSNYNREFVTKEDIDAAPAVSCEECRYAMRIPTAHEPMMSCDCASSPCVGRAVWAVFSCGEFERRQP